MINPSTIDSYNWELNVSEGGNEMIEECALNIVKNLEKNIIAYRHDLQRANRLASMNKYIQVNYLIKKKKTD